MKSLQLCMKRDFLVASFVGFMSSAMLCCFLAKCLEVGDSPVILCVNFGCGIHDCSVANKLWGVVSQAPACKTIDLKILFCAPKSGLIVIWGVTREHFPFRTVCVYTCLCYAYR